MPDNVVCKVRGGTRRGKTPLGGGYSTNKNGHRRIPTVRLMLERCGLFQVVVIVHDVLSLRTRLFHNGFADNFIEGESRFIIARDIVISHFFSLFCGQTPVNALAKTFVLDILADRRAEVVLLEARNGTLMSAILPMMESSGAAPEIRATFAPCSFACSAITAIVLVLPEPEL